MAQSDFRADRRPVADAERDPATLPVSRRILLIAGMHRSGTSAVTRVFNILGAQTPKDLLGAAPSNERGHWEPLKVIGINDEILQAAGSSWDDWRPFNSDWRTSDRARDFRTQLVDCLKEQYGDAPLSVLKDPRICRMLPFWLDVVGAFGASPVVVIPFRNPVEVAASLRKRNGMSAAKSHLMWLRHVLDAEYHSRGLPRAILAYDDLLKSWKSVAAAVATAGQVSWAVGMADAEDAIGAFLSPELKHHQTQRLASDADGPFAAWAIAVHQVMEEIAREGDRPRHRARLDGLRRTFEAGAAGLEAVVADMERQFKTERDLLRIRGHAGQELSQQLDREKQRRAAQEVRINALSISLTLAGKAADDAERSAAAAIAALQTEAAAEREQRLLREREAEALTQRLAQETAQRAAQAREIATLQAALAAERDEAARLTTLLSGRARGIARLNSELRDKDALLAVDKARIAALTADRAQAERRLADAAYEEREANARAAHLRAVADAQRRTIDAQVVAAEAAPAAPARGGLATLLRLRRPPPPLNPAADIIRAAGLFDPVYYLARNPDVAAAGDDPLAHFIRYGAAERRRPNPLFDIVYYRWKYPGAVADADNALIHYIRAGAAEGLNPHPLFHSAWYLHRYPEVAALGLNPLAHFLAVGARHGFDPNPLFDTSWYLAQNPDVLAAGDNALYHYLVHGAKEGRSPHALFDGPAYARAIPDLGGMTMTPLEHYFMKNPP